MERRVWTGVLAGVAAALVLGMVALVSFRAGQDDEGVTRVVRDGDGDIVRVVEDGWHGGPGFGFFLFPLLLILVLVLLFRGRQHGYGNGGPGRWGPGYWGGPGGRWGHHGYGPPPEADPRWEEWHRQAHGEAPSSGQPPETEEAEAPPVPPPRDTA